MHSIKCIKKTYIYVCLSTLVLWATVTPLYAVHTIINATPHTINFHASYATAFCKDNRETIHSGGTFGIDPKACSLKFIKAWVHTPTGLVEASQYNGPFGALGINGAWIITGPFDGSSGFSNYVVTRFVQ